jgi:hypothetical protein
MRKKAAFIFPMGFCRNKKAAGEFPPGLLRSKRAALLTVSTFVIFIAFIALFTVINEQNNKTYDEMSKLSAADSVFYEFDSIETGISQLVSEIWNITTSGNNETTNIDIWVDVPVHTSALKAERYIAFAKEHSRYQINSSLDFGNFVIMPQNITLSSGNKIVTTPINTPSSLGKLKGYRLDIYWNGNATITSADALNNSGIELAINIYSLTGQKLRSYDKMLDPSSKSNITLSLTGNNITPQPSKIVNVSINSPGRLEISPEDGLEFYMRERIILASGDATEYLAFNNAWISVADQTFGVWKHGEVRV